MNLLEAVIKQILVEASIRTKLKVLTETDKTDLKLLQSHLGIKPIMFVPSSQRRSDLTDTQIKDLGKAEAFQQFDGFRVILQGFNTQLTPMEQRDQLVAFLSNIQGNTTYKEKMKAGYSVFVSVNQHSKSNLPKENNPLFVKYEFLVFYASNTLPLKITSPKLETLRSGADLYSYEAELGIPLPKYEPVKKGTTILGIATGFVPVFQLQGTPTTPALNKLFLSWFFNSKAAVKLYKTTYLAAYVLEQIRKDSTPSCELGKIIQGYQQHFGLPATGVFDESTQKHVLSQIEWRNGEDSNLISIPGIGETNEIPNRVGNYIADLIEQGCEIRDIKTASKQLDVKVKTLKDTVKTTRIAYDKANKEKTIQDANTNTDAESLQLKNTAYKNYYEAAFAYFTAEQDYIQADPDIIPGNKNKQLDYFRKQLELLNNWATEKGIEIKQVTPPKDETESDETESDTKFLKGMNPNGTKYEAQTNPVADPNFHEVQKLLLEAFEKYGGTGRTEYKKLKKALENPNNQGQYYRHPRGRGATQQAVKTVKNMVQQIKPGWVDTDANTVSNAFIAILYEILKK